MARIILIFVFLFSGAVAVAQTNTIYYKISSGTGFVVNNEGHVVTNAHVVRDCRAISILTAKGEEQAELVAADSDQDLAVLKTPYISPNVAPMRWNIDGLQVGDPVVVMGYPGAEGAFGQEAYKKTSVTSLRGPAGDAHFIQLKSVAAHGNSGGPVLDGSGNVIAVISGIAVTYHAGRDGKPEGAPVGQADVAITLAALRDFLRDHGVGFFESASSGIGYGDGVLHDTARHFIVPVRCIQDVERR